MVPVHVQALRRGPALARGDDDLPTAAVIAGQVEHRIGPKTQGVAVVSPGFLDVEGAARGLVHEHDPEALLRRALDAGGVAVGGAGCEVVGHSGPSEVGGQPRELAAAADDDLPPAAVGAQ